MKLKYLIPIIFATATAQATEATPATPPTAANAEYSQDDISKYLEFIRRAEAIHNKATADAYATEHEKLRNEAEQQAKAHNITPEELDDALAYHGYTTEKLLDIEQRLEENEYFGSIKLAFVMDPSYLSEIELPSLPTEARPHLTELLQKAIASKGYNITGGPGFTSENAWVWQASTRMCEYSLAALLQQLPILGEPLLNQTQNEKTKRHYFVAACAMEYKDKPYTFTLWFDVTAHVLIFADDAENDQEEAEIEAICNRAAELTDSILQKLESVHDREGADYTAIELAKDFSEFSELYAKHGELVGSIMIAPHNNRAERMETQQQRLAEKYFYGSVALAEALGKPAAMAKKPAELTPEVRQQIEQELRNAVATLLPEGALSGGPGLEMSSAWIVPADEVDDISAFQALISSLPDCTFIEHRITKVDGKHYTRVTCLFIRNGESYHVDVWFDITAFVLKMQQLEDEEYDDEYGEDVRNNAQAEVITQLADLAVQVLRIIDSVHDQASADAAAQQLVSLKAKMLELEQYSIQDELIIRALEEKGISRDMFLKTGDRLRDADFYGSEALRNIFMP
ncbi:MAG: hypothetical protein IJA63_06720 [Akkermansia sp.]|nr:hypothetical protein [Akkermansia sp.]